MDVKFVPPPLTIGILAVTSLWSIIVFVQLIVVLPLSCRNRSAKCRWETIFVIIPIVVLFVYYIITIIDIVAQNMLNTPLFTVDIIQNLELTQDYIYYWLHPAIFLPIVLIVQSRCLAHKVARVYPVINDCTVLIVSACFCLILIAIGTFGTAAVAMDQSASQSGRQFSIRTYNKDIFITNAFLYTEVALRVFFAALICPVCWVLRRKYGEDKILNRMSIIAMPMLLLEAILSMILVICGSRSLTLDALLTAELVATIIRGSVFCGLFTLMIYLLFGSSITTWQPLQDDDHIPLRPKVEKQIVTSSTLAK